MAFPKKIPEGVRVVLLALLLTAGALWILLGRQFCETVIGEARPGSVFMLRERDGLRTRVVVVKHDWPYGDVFYQLPNGNVLQCRADFFLSMSR